MLSLADGLGITKSATKSSSVTLDRPDIQRRIFIGTKGGSARRNNHINRSCDAPLDPCSINVFEFARMISKYRADNHRFDCFVR